MTTRHSVRRLLADSALAWLAACAAGVLWLMPTGEGLGAFAWRTWLAGSALLMAALWHWVTLARAAGRTGHSAAAWLGLSVLLFPVGGAAALMLLWLGLQAPLTSRMSAQR